MGGNGLSARRWRQEVGYHQRSLAETTMYRVKQTFGSHLKNRDFENQQTEARLRCKICPASVRVELVNKAICESEILCQTV
jgi:hypothetical protein